MRADDVTDTLDLALKVSSCESTTVLERTYAEPPRRLRRCSYISVYRQDREAEKIRARAVSTRTESMGIPFVALM
jgi:hypothetical protein